MICKQIFLITFLNEPELIFYTLLNGSKYSYSNKSIKHQLFVYTQFNDQTVLFVTIQFSIS